MTVVLREHTSLPRDTSGCAGRRHLVGGQRPGVLLNVLRCHGQLPQSEEFSRTTRRERRGWETWFRAAVIQLDQLPAVPPNPAQSPSVRGGGLAEPAR